MKGLLGLISISVVELGVGRLPAGSSQRFHMLLAVWLCPHQYLYTT